MLRQTLKLINICNNTKTFLKANISTKTAAKGEKWDLLAAVCLERKPVITQELNDLEKEYKQYLAEVELERSLKSDFELKNELELKQIELLKKGGSDDLDVSLKQTAQDFADASIEELNAFKFSSKVTDADKKNDVKSINRKLDRHLVLVLSQKLGDKNYFLLPQGKRQDGETLRQAADRVLKESCGTELRAQIYGNSPSGFYKYKYPLNIRNETGTVGAKVFIYFARHINGQIPVKSIEFKWLDRTELKKTMPTEYENCVRQMLVDE